jgi:hypothetical protein
MLNIEPETVSMKPSRVVAQKWRPHSFDVDAMHGSRKLSERSDSEGPHQRVHRGAGALQQCRTQTAAHQASSTHAITNKHGSISDRRRDQQTYATRTEHTAAQTA